jgi:hypothetical protein
LLTRQSVRVAAVDPRAKQRFRAAEAAFAVARRVDRG